jgi:hypothetical protein
MTQPRLQPRSRPKGPADLDAVRDDLAGIVHSRLGAGPRLGAGSHRY